MNGMPKRSYRFPQAVFPLPKPRQAGHQRDFIAGLKLRILIETSLLLAMLSKRRLTMINTLSPARLRFAARFAAPVVMVAALTLTLCGCSLLGIGGPTPHQRADDLEPMLAGAGFRMILADTPAKMQHLKTLPPLKVNYYTGSDGTTHYWFADPDYCHCLYVGDETAYQEYENLRTQARIAKNEQEAAEENYEAQQQMQMNMMSPFGYGFGPEMGFGF